MQSKISLLSDELFSEIVKTSFSFSECLRKCPNVNFHGGFIKYVKQRIIDSKLDISHFNGKSSDKISINKYDDSEVFTNDCKLSLDNSSLKRRYLKIRNTISTCAICNISNWQDKQLNLQLDHIDGNRKNNELSNLRLLCPNCHSQTSTFCRGIATTKYKNNINNLCVCGNNKSTISTHCRKCACLKRTYKHKINWPSIEELSDLIWKKPISLIAKELGISDNSIHKFCRKNKINKPTQGYWLINGAHDGTRTHNKFGP